MSETKDLDIVDSFNYVLARLHEANVSPNRSPNELQETFRAAVQLTVAAELTRIADALDTLTDGQKLASLVATLVAEMERIAPEVVRGG